MTKNDFAREVNSNTILTNLRIHGQMKASELAKRVRLHPSTVRRYLAKLAEAGVVGKSVRDDGNRWFAVVPESEEGEKAPEEDLAALVDEVLGDKTKIDPELRAMHEIHKRLMTLSPPSQRRVLEWVAAKIGTPNPFYPIRITE